MDLRAWPRSKRLLFPLLALCVFVPQPGSAEGSPATYSRQAAFHAVALTHGELIELLGRIDAFLATVNSSFKGDESRSVQVSDGVISVHVQGNQPLEELRRGPDPAYRVHFSYQAIRVSSSWAPVEKVTLDLADSSRSLELEGTDRTQVDALVALISEEINKHTTRFGGIWSRFLIGFASLVLPWSLFMYLDSPWGRTARDKFLLFPLRAKLLLVLITSMVPLLGLLLVATDIGTAWLPGTFVYTREPSFWGHVSFWITIVLAMLGIAVSWYWGRRSVPRRD